MGPAVGVQVLGRLVGNVVGKELAGFTVGCNDDGRDVGSTLGAEALGLAVGAVGRLAGERVGVELVGNPVGAHGSFQVEQIVLRHCIVASTWLGRAVWSAHWLIDKLYSSDTQFVAAAHCL